MSSRRSLRHVFGLKRSASAPLRAAGRAASPRAFAEPACMEAFEPRTLLAAVFWDGGAGTNSWHDAANWNRGGADAVPLNGDDVTISVAANPTITFNTGTLTLASLVTDEALTIAGGNLGLQIGGTADINAALTMQGGTMSGGAWDVTGGTLRATTSGGAISNAQISGDITCDATSVSVVISGSTRFSAARLSGNNAQVQFAPGYVLNDLVVAEGAAPGNRVIAGAVGGSGTLTISPTGVIRLAAGSGGGLSISNSSQATVINNGLIAAEAANRTLTINSTALTNNASMTVTAGTLDISPTTFTNASPITATNVTLNITATSWTSSGAISATGSTVSLSGAWSTTAPITVNNTTLTLGGTFSTGSFIVNRTGGTVNLTGTLLNTANTFTFNASTGSWNLLGGNVTGGTLAFSGADRLLPTSSGGLFTDVQVNGDLLFDTTSANVRINGSTRFVTARLAANNAQIQFSPGYTLNDVVIVEGAAAGNRIVQGAVGGTGTLTISPTGVIRLAAGSGGGLAISNSSQATVINNGLIAAEAANRTLTINTTTLTNNASLTVTAGTLDINTTTFTNASPISATDVTLNITATNWTNPSTITATGSTVNFGGAWSSTGAITLNNCTTSLGGTFTTSGIVLNRTGGTVNLTGILTNTGNTFTFNAATGSWNLLAGSILGGTVNFIGADRLIPTSSGGILTDVQIGGNLVFDTTSASLRVTGATRFTSIRLAANNAQVEFVPGYTLQDQIIVEGAAAGARVIRGAVGGTGTLTVTPTGIIRVASGAGGGLNIQNSSLLTLVNNGLIACDAAGRTLSFGNSNVTNNAMMTASAGVLDITPTNFTNSPGATIAATDATLTLGGAWSNSGTITVVNSILNLGGTFSITMAGTLNRSGGTVNLTGTMNNAANTFTFTAATGSWVLSGGTINGGSLVFTGSDRLLTSTNGGLLNDVLITGDLLIDTTSASVRVSGSTRFSAVRLTANNAQLETAPGYTLFDLVSTEGPATGGRILRGAVGGAGTLTIGASGIVRLAAGSGGSLVVQNSNIVTFINNGLISAEAASRSLSFNNTTVTNNATMSATAGTLDITPTNFTNAVGATLSGTNATITLGGNWANAGTITINNTTLNLGGTFTLTAAGVINRTGGTINLTGTLNNTGNTFTFNAASGSWNLQGGTVMGGTLVFNGADRLTMTSNGGGLRDVLVNGELLIDTTSASVLVSGTTRFTAARLSANNAQLEAAPGYTLFDLVSVEGAAAGTRALRGAVGGPGTLTIGASGIIRLAAGSGGSLAIQNSNIVTVVNNGLISAEAASRTLAFNNTTVTNNGTIAAVGGTLDLSPTNWTNSGTLSAVNATFNTSGTWSSTGFITENNSTLNLGGTFSLIGLTLPRTGGTINLTGAAANTGNTFTFTPTTGSWNLAGGTITGGTIIQGTTDRLSFTTVGGTLADVQVTGDLILDIVSSSVRAQGTTRFTATRLAANNAQFEASPGYTLHDLIVAEGATAGTRVVRGAVGGVGTFTISPTGAIRIAPGSSGGLSFQNSNLVTLTNNGIIASESNGRTLDIGVSVVTNISGNTLNGGTWIASGTGSLTFSISGPATVITTNNANVTVGGSTTNGGATSFPSLATLNTNNGTLSTAGGGTFTITPAGGTLTNNSTISLSPGNTIAVTGNVVLASQAVLNVRVNGILPNAIGHLNATGSATLSGAVNIVTVNGFDPTCINSPFINASTTINQFTSQSLPPAHVGMQAFLVYIAGEVRFAISPPSDYNRDGFLNSQDVFDYLAQFFTFSAEADFNNDGFVNSQDFFDFIADFFTGCP